MKVRTKFNSLASNETIVMALSLDKKRKQEHIVIGPKSQVHLRIAEIPTAQVLFDQKRPLGTILFECEEQVQSDWNLYVHAPLSQALASWVGRKGAEQSVLEYLEPHLNSNNAVCKYAAHWAVNEYCNYITHQGSPDHSSLYQDSAANISRFFRHLILDDAKNSTVGKALQRVQTEMSINGLFMDSSATIWYPSRAQAREWLIISCSLFPAALYYLQRLQDWGFGFCKCSVCGKIFLAPNLHYNLCSTACRNVRNRQNKQAFDERAKGNGYDIDYKNTAQRLRNRLTNLKEQPNISEIELQKAQEAFDHFRKSALQKKKKIKTEEECTSFRRWMLQQEREFEHLCNTITNSAY